MTYKPYELEISPNERRRDGDYSCPHCNRQQIITYVQVDLRGLKLEVRQCLTCREFKLDMQIVRYNSIGQDPVDKLALYPAERTRAPQPFVYAPHEVLRAYEEACRLYGMHIGSAGAYARRGLELILDRAGYTKPTLAASIDAASKEPDGEKRLPKRLLTKLDYVKEIGNFALHVRRDGELAIVEIDQDEVEACLEILEELVVHLFEEPGRDRTRTIALNMKLRAAGKKEIAVPDLPITAIPDDLSS